MKGLQAFFWVTDIGFLLYWAVTFLDVIPPEYLYQDYADPNLVAWNLSFLPLDLFISFTGLASLYAYRKGWNGWQQLALVSLVLTFCSGLQAIAFWAFTGYYDPAWWFPNLYLLLYPLWFLPRFLRGING